MAKYWFAAKTRGWGWGRPLVWQGWAVVVIFGFLIAVGTVLLPPKQDWAPYLGYVAGLIALLLGVCWAKGEPSRRVPPRDG